ncbi:MAG: trehalose-phosphatase [Acidobacteriota bacterium]
MHIENLLDPESRALLQQWAKPSTLMAFDFDGTLAPIVDDPARASMTEPAWNALKALASVARVAVISGRGRDNLSRLVPHEVSYLIGNHGCEGLPQRDPNFADKAITCADWYDKLISNPSLKSVTQGALIENKGLSLALHYRHCQNQALARSKLLARASELTPPPRIIRGCYVINLLPPPAVTKREALLALMADCGAERAIFVGDDFTDELVFEDAPDNWLTVRVGEVVFSQARYCIHSVQEMTSFLELLTQLLRPPAGQPVHQPVWEAKTG